MLSGCLVQFNFFPCKTIFKVFVDASFSKLLLKVWLKTSQLKFTVTTIENVLPFPTFGILSMGYRVVNLFTAPLLQLSSLTGVFSRRVEIKFWLNSFKNSSWWLLRHKISNQMSYWTNLNRWKEDRTTEIFCWPYQFFWFLQFQRWPFDIVH